VQGIARTTAQFPDQSAGGNFSPVERLLKPTRSALVRIGHLAYAYRRRESQQRDPMDTANVRWHCPVHAGPIATQQRRNATGRLVAPWATSLYLPISNRVARCNQAIPYRRGPQCLHATYHNADS